MEEHLIGYAIDALIQAGIIDPATRQKAIEVIDKRFEDNVSFWWHIIDVQGYVSDAYPDLSDEKAREILQFCNDHHDCNYGMTWDHISAAADEVMRGGEAA